MIVKVRYGKWVAYVSDESDRDEVYMARYPDLDNRIAVSTDGGIAPKWSRNGREIYYRRGDSVMVAPVNTALSTVGKPTVLFTGDYSGASHDLHFDVAPDGRRLVIVKSDPASTLRQLVVVQNWFSELSRRAPSRNP
jgi:Tol biopolymer transport system component